jgi:hypothetical protein
MNRLKRAKVQEVINSLNLKKSLRYDLITGKILKELLIIGIIHNLTQLFNDLLLKGYFPAQCKVAQIILILKPGKPNELTSYWPVTFSILFKRLLQMVENNGLMPNYQFGFRQRHSTMEHIKPMSTVLQY